MTIHFFDAHVGPEVWLEQWRRNICDVYCNGLILYVYGDMFWPKFKVLSEMLSDFGGMKNKLLFAYLWYISTAFF